MNANGQGYAIAAQIVQEHAASALADATLAKLRALPPEQYRRSVHWRSLCRVVLRERGARCEACGDSRIHVDVYARAGARRGQERRGDVRVLCGACRDEAEQ